ncbi:peptide/nickel transport system substrate-binding protein [Hathewaya proteolytica DSM 3090]|uniref:Peptide/nickel transport system substrate-binding protein n=1 Tax=Hathewaya proteolytica DSM 3090 TaxID=1121331 RepID=A0A1M6KHP7_9CLOT|nr:ABC transporter substrate-binding protein [Hathewaya proteolytica]SHJ58476.1 peptide/nickel transport system substrate-binding protein [Hathewaya proteolytica DSM 3090]
MKLRKKVLAVLLAAVLAIGTGCNAAGDKNGATKNDTKKTQYSSKNGDVMVLTLFQNPKTLDIQKTNADYFIPLQIYDRLVEVKVSDSGETEVIPSLAEKWDISNDGLVYTFHLRKGVKFHNGEEFKADDVLFTIDKAVNPDEACVNASQFADIKGYQDRLDGKSKVIEGVKVTDDYTVQITLEKPSSSFLASLTGAPASIFNRKAVEEGKDKFGFEPKYTVGTGYMKFKDWTQDKEINLVKNDDYFNGPAKIGGVRYLMNIDKSTERMMFENGELDYMKLSPENLDYFKGNELWKKNIGTHLPPSMDYFLFNQNDKFLADENIRKAVQLAINRDLMNKTFYNGEGIILNGVLPPAIPGYNDKQPKIQYNLEEAKALLKKAGHENDVKLTLLQNGESEYTHPMNEMVQSMLAEVGIKVEIKNMDMTSFWDTVSKGEGFSMYLGPVTADVPDPGQFFTTFTVENSKSNGYNIKDKDLSKKIEEANGILDANERIKALQDLEKVITSEKSLYLPIVGKKMNYIISPRLKNFKLGWQGWVCCSTHDVEIDKSYNK